MTGNFKIIRDNKKFFSTKGPKNEENKMISFGKAKLDIIAGLNESIETWCTKHGYDKNYSLKSNIRIHHL